jgi:polyisoprenyl-phosphate glycosyltransferase
MSPIFSIVVPAYREGKNLPILVERCTEMMNGLANQPPWEMVIVDDGCPDDTWPVIKSLSARYPNVRGLHLARNFGKEVALTAGIHAAGGQAVICMDADLQHPPEAIPKLIACWHAGSKVVATRRTLTKLPLMRRVGSRVYYWLMSKVAGVNLTSQATDFGLYDRSVVDAFSRMTERNRMFRGMIDWLGTPKTFVEFESHERLHGEAGYSYRKLVGLAINSVTSFSLFPLRLTGYLGLVIFFLSVLLLAFMLMDKFFTQQFGFTSLAFVVVANTVFIGVVLMALGIMALYIGSIHTEVINRPLYVVGETSGPE